MWRVTAAGGVGISRYLTQSTYVSASQETIGTRQDRQASLNYTITPEIDLTTSASANSGNQILLNWHKEY